MSSVNSRTESLPTSKRPSATAHFASRSPRPRQHRSARHRVACAAVALLLLSIPQRDALAAAGDLDPAFGSGGLVLTSTTASASASYDVDAAYAIAVQTDGKIVAAGNTTNVVTNAGRNFCVVRYNADGTLDATFGNGGIVRTAVSASNEDNARSVAIQSDGKILAAGYAPNSSRTVDMAVVRYLPNGALDSGFGGGGKVLVSFGKKVGSSAHAVLVQADGRIVLAGNSSGKFAVARLSTTGSLDSTFGSGGKATVAPSPSGTSVDVRSATLQTVGSEQRIVVAGNGFSSGDSNLNFMLMRFRPSGAVDTEFGANGTVITDFYGYQDKLFDVAVDGANRIVAVGHTSTSASLSGFDFALARYTTDGNLDPSFGAGGRVATNFFGFQDTAQGVTIRPSDGAIVVVGQVSPTPTTFKFAVAQYEANGVLDPSFGQFGQVVTDFVGGPDLADTVAIQQVVVEGTVHERVVAAGRASTGAGNDFALARYLD